MVKKRAHREHLGKYIGKHEVKKEEIKHVKPTETKKLLTNILKPKIIIPVIVVLVIAAIILFMSLPKISTKVGDSVKIQYTMQLEDGTIIEDGSDTFKVGEIGQQFMLASDKLDKEIIKIKEGEEKTFVLEAKDAAGEYDSTYIEEINRTRDFNRTMILPYSLDMFKQQYNRSPIIGEGLPFNSLWNVTVMNFTNETMTIKHGLKEGDILPLPPDGNVTVHLTEDKVILFYNPGKQLMVSGSEVVNVVDVTADKFIIDYNSKYAGKKVTVKIKVLSIEKAKDLPAPVAEIPGAPVLDVFVMSYCPFGTQIEKGLIPVYELLGQKANIKLRFVYYTMHGDQEDQENKRQLCIREEQKDKFWPYLKCFLDAGDADSCLTEVNADKAKVTSCMSTNADTYWDVDKALNTKYGVKGSPTVVLDGKEANPASRGPEDIKQMLCKAFTTAPTECSQKLSTEAPSAGFGYSASSSTTSSNSGCASA